MGEVVDFFFVNADDLPPCGFGAVDMDFDSRFHEVILSSLQDWQFDMDDF